MTDKKLQNEKQMLEDALERSKSIIRTSEAAEGLYSYVKANTDKDPFVNTGLNNPYTKKVKEGGGCNIL